MAKSPDEMKASMIANLKEKTGKTLPQWMKITKTSKLEKHGQILKMLKTEHGITHGFANLIAHETLAAAKSNAKSKSDSDPVAIQYSGAKQELRPIYDAVIEAVQKFGDDVEVAPKKSYVSLRRHKQFAIIQPSTKTRVDVGINLKKDVKATKRLELSGSFNAMVSHRVRLEDKKQVNAELKKWLKQAYENA